MRECRACRRIGRHPASTGRDAPRSAANRDSGPPSSRRRLVAGLSRRSISVGVGGSPVDPERPYGSGPAVSGRSRRQTLLLQSCQDEPVDRVLNPCGSLDARRLRFDWSLESPLLLPRGTLVDPCLSLARSAAG